MYKRREQDWFKTPETADAVLPSLRDFAKINSVLKLLRYSDGKRRLFGSDDLFAGMLFETGGNIGLSQACYERGNRIRVLNGFLKDCEGLITNVNRKKKTVEVTVNLHEKKIVMWQGYELVAAVENPA